MTKKDGREAQSNLFAVIRVRGRVDVRPEVRHTLALLRLHKSNHCVLLRNDETTKGTLQVVKDWITWGEINKDTLKKLLQKRAGLTGGKRGLSEENIKETTAYKNMDELVESLLATKITPKEIKGLKPVFRLHPPRKGYSGIKKSYNKGGALGYRGRAINTLLHQMV